jgi:hypothetical protein
MAVEVGTHIIQVAGVEVMGIAEDLAAIIMNWLHAIQQFPLITGVSGEIL